MDALDRAKSTAQASVDEVLDNLRIREDFTPLFVGRSRELYAYKDFKLYPGLNDQLRAALSRKGTSADAVYRGLFVEVNSAFERGVKSVANAVVTHRQATAPKFSLLNRAFRDRHTVHSAKVLAKLHDGEINGSTYDFAELQRTLGICFTDTEPLQLNADIFTVFLGNCTPKRLADLFEALDLSPPFDDGTGKNAAVRKWSGNKGAREAALAATKALESQLALRNSIVHGPLGGDSVVATDIERAAELTLALLDAFIEKARISTA